jgi:predicted nucleotidyltransferase component of viral defense system
MQIDNLTFIEVADALGMGNPAIVEKDYYVVELLKIISNLTFETHTLVFSGGTALSKSGVKTHRMSEDIDIKLIPTSEFKKLNSNGKRKAARKNIAVKLKTKISESSIFSLVDEGQIFSEYRYQLFNIKYPQKHSQIPCLRPLIKLEFIETQLYDPIDYRSIISLVGEAYKQPEDIDEMACSSIASTQAEKLISMLRRTASHQRNKHRDDDPALIRHIYDTYYIQQALSYSEFQHIVNLVAFVIKEDLERYGNQHDEFYKNPIIELRYGLQCLTNDSKYEIRFNQYVVPMVYGSDRLDWQSAFTVFESFANNVLVEIFL